MAAVFVCRLSFVVCRLSFVVCRLSLETTCPVFDLSGREREMLYVGLIDALSNAGGSCCESSCYLSFKAVNVWRRAGNLSSF